MSGEAKKLKNRKLSVTWEASRKADPAHVERNISTRVTLPNAALAMAVAVPVCKGSLIGAKDVHRVPGPSVLSMNSHAMSRTVMI